MSSFHIPLKVDDEFRESPREQHLRSLYSHSYRFPYLYPPNISGDPMRTSSKPCLRFISWIFLIGFALTMCLKFQETRFSMSFSVAIAICSASSTSDFGIAPLAI